MQNHPPQGQLSGLIANCIISGILYREFMREASKEYLVQELVKHKLNQCKAARELGMHRNTLSRTIAELKIDLAALRNPKKRVRAAAQPQSAALVG